MEEQVLRNVFARTYDPPRDLDPITLREDYERFVSYRAEHPSAGRYKTANAIGIPTSRARAWIDGAKPDVVRGTEIAADRGWFATAGKTHLALTHLVTGIFAAGSINERWVPRWSASDRRRFDQFLTMVNAGVDRVIRDTEQQGDEIQPASHGTVLGRILVARGAPRAHVSEYEIPAYLFEDQTTGRAFVETYVQCRGVSPTGRNHIQIYEQNRSTQYHDDLCELLTEHTDGEVARVKQGILIRPTTVEQTDWLWDAATS